MGQNSSQADDVSTNISKFLSVIDTNTCLLGNTHGTKIIQ